MLGSKFALSRWLGPHLTQCRSGRGLPSYQVASWSIESFDQNRYGPKIGELCPFWARGTSPCNAMWPGPRPTRMSSFILIRPTVWPRYTNVTDRAGQTDSGPIAYRANRFTNGRPKMEKKSPYLGNFTDRHKIWPCDAVWLSWAFQPLEIWKSKNPRWRRPPPWKIKNRHILVNTLTNRHEIWHGDTASPLGRYDR